MPSSNGLKLDSTIFLFPLAALAAKIVWVEGLYMALILTFPLIQPLHLSIPDTRPPSLSSEVSLEMVDAFLLVES